MRNLAAALQSFLLGRPTGISSRILIWIEARNRSSGAIETMGLWTGVDAQVFTIRGEQRSYFGAGTVISVDTIKTVTGVRVQSQRASLSKTSLAVRQAVLGYETRHAPIEIHRAMYDPQTGLLLAEPHRIFKGLIDRIDWPRDPENTEGAATLSLVSSARALTRTLPLKYSDASMSLRGGDRLFRNADVSGSVPVYWGEKKIEAKK